MARPERTLFSIFRRGSANALVPSQAESSREVPFRLTPRHGVFALLAAELVLVLLEVFGTVPEDWKVPVAVTVTIMAATAAGVAVLAWLRLTPRHVVFALLAVEAVLPLLELFRTHVGSVDKGCTVLTAVAILAATLAFLFVWFLFALLFSLRFQFSISSLLLLVVATALPISWLGREMEQARKQKTIVDAIIRLGGAVGYDYRARGFLARSQPRPPSPTTFLGQLFGEEFFADVIVCEFTTDVDLHCLEGLPALRRLWLGDVTDEGLEPVERLTSLEELLLPYTKVTDAGLVHLKGLKNLRLLLLAYTRVTDAGLVHLKGLESLDDLDLRDTAVTDAGLAHLRGLKSLTWIMASRTGVSEKGARELLKSLPHCCIHCDAGYFGHD
jgi:hypothetical protein